MKNMNLDEVYDPYDDIQNDRYYKCKRGKIKRTSMCCKECWIEEREKRKTYEKRKPILYTYTDIPLPEYDNCNYTHVNTKKEIVEDDDWLNLKLIPPKNREEIRKQYKLLCLQYHPDKVGGDGEDFIKITDSYNNLYN